MTDQPYQPPPYQPPPQQARASMSLPEWALPAMLLALTAGGAGYTGGTVSSGQDPAVLESKLGGLEGQVQSMGDKIDRLQQAVQTAGMDRYTRSDHNQWVASEHMPLRQMLVDHIATEGHPSGMRMLVRIEAEIAAHEARIVALEQGITASTPATPRRR